MLIDHCIIRFNQTKNGTVAGGNGAGINHSPLDEVTAYIVNSTIHDNSCGNGTGDGGFGGSGGGIMVQEGSMTLTNCTISGNSAGNGDTGGGGGGIFVLESTLYLNNCTITGNEAGEVEDVAYGGFGGGIIDYDEGNATIHAKNCIIANNTAPSGWGNDIWTIDQSGAAPGEFMSHGCNIIGDEDGWQYTTGTGSDTTGDQLGIDPMLGDLADNSGFTPTHALLSGSPAIDGVLDDYCMTIENGIGNGTSVLVTVDQRDISRPQDGDGDGLD